MTKRTSSETAREHILSKGLELFNRQGYHATGLKEILDAAGIPKGSFYHYFESKEHFAVEIINHYRGLNHDRWEQEFSNAPGTRLQQIRTALTTLIEEYEAEDTKIGCLIANLSGELANSSPYFRSAIQASTEEVLLCITEDIAQAQQEGDLRSDLPARDLAELFWDAWQGAMLRMKVTRSTRPLRLTLNLLLNNLLAPSTPSRTDTLS